MKVLIIEDEQPAARRLGRLILEIVPGASVLATIDAVSDAVEFFRGGIQPDLVFMDIQLADGLSFDIFQKAQVHAPVIFTTAYDHYAVKAFKVNSVDYLLKPIEPDELKKAIDKWKLLFRNEKQVNIDYTALAQAIALQKEPFKKRFLVKAGTRLNFINVEDIAFFFSEDGTSFLATKAGDRFLLEGTMDELEQSLEPAAFFRINRKMIVALSAIRKIEPHFNNRFVLDVQPPFDEEIVVSRQRSAEFRSWLDK